MLRYNRVLWLSTGTLKDLSVNMSNPLSGTEGFAYVSSGDILYLGSDLPFNHRWFEMSVVNSGASVASVYNWNGSSWQLCVDLIDQTQGTAGKSLSQSGIISFVPDRVLGSWNQQFRTEEMTGDANLSTVKIYDLYWTKWVFSGSMSGTTALKYIGHKFANDEDLNAEYPDLANTALMDAYTSGKTNWNDQHFISAEYVIEDLRNLGVIWSKNQILDPRILKPAAVHKCAEMIFNALGDDYKDDKKSAGIAYSKAMSKKSFNVDTDNDARLSPGEKLPQTNWLTR